MKTLVSTFAAVLALTGGAAPAFAADPAQASYDQAKVLYEGRADAAKLAQAIALLDKAEKVAVDTELKYDIMILNARSVYFQGATATKDDEKVRLHAAGEAKAEAAKKLHDEYAEAYYVAALNIARWAEAKGVLASLSRKNDLLANLEGAKSRITRTIAPGETIDGFGPNRIMGRVFYKLPGFAGGSRDRSLQLLEVCFKNNPDYPINVAFYAESLAAGSAAERTLAKKILDELLAKDPKTINPSRVPESEYEFQEARKLRAQLGT